MRSGKCQPTNGRRYALRLRTLVSIADPPAHGISLERALLHGGFAGMTGKSSKLLTCGIVLAPLFYVVVGGQMVTRSGFDITRHPLSLLALGDAGWIQVANFLVAGSLAVACGFGIHATLAGAAGGTWGSLLIATYGIGMIVAGISPADPIPGFPPGFVSAIPPPLSRHAIGHGLGFLLAFASLIAACFVFARRFRQRGDRGWARYSMATGGMTLLLLALGMAVKPAASLSFFVVGIFAFSWIGALAAKISHDARYDTHTRT